MTLGTFYFMNSSLCFAQHKLDSLNGVLKTEKEDTNKVNTLNSLASGYDDIGNMNIADSLAKNALQLASSLNYKNGQAGALITIGYISIGRGNYSEAMKAFSQSLELCKATSDSAGIANAYSCIGLSYRDQGNYSEALKNYLIALRIRERLGNKRAIGNSDNNLGNIYEGLEDFPNAEKYFKDALAIFTEAGYKAGIAGINNNLGGLYLSMHQLTKAMACYKVSLGIRESIHDKLGISGSYNNIAMVYDKQADSLNYGMKDKKAAQALYSVALETYYKSLKMKRELGYVPGLASAYNNIGNVLTKMNNYPLSKKYLDSAIALSTQIGEKELTRDAYDNLSVLDSLMGNYKEAYEDFKIKVALNDSLKNEENTKKIVSQEMQYEFDKKQAEEKAQQDKKDAIANADKRKQDIITIAVSLGLLVVVIFSALLYSRFRLTDRQKHIIEEQKALVEEKNKEVLDSITYAKRLQDAILPPVGTIQQYFPESFVLYKPKDIVAGDFYWLEVAHPLPFPVGRETEALQKVLPTGEDLGGADTVLIAAADCTGHGVPGAMVSVVCSNALNRTVKEFKITKPGKILDKTRELVIETFEKSEGNIQDGMDISLAAISRRHLDNSIEVKWSGAYNSLWYIEKGEIKEVAADKQPIGKTDNPKPFTTHTITFPLSGGQRGALYLFTDGYADQFGGEKGKKFKYKQLQQLLIDNAQLTMAEQKKVLEKTLTDWQGELQQVDDILIIGIRV